METFTAQKLHLDEKNWADQTGDVHAMEKSVYGSCHGLSFVLLRKM